MEEIAADKSGNDLDNLDAERLQFLKSVLEQ
jgi:hypothetical protein